MSELSLLILLKIAYVAVGLVLCLLGKSLIEKKLEVNFRGEGSVGESTFKVVTTSPGLIFLIAGLFAIGAAIFQEFEIVDSSRESADKQAADNSSSALQTSHLLERTRQIRFAGGDQSLVSVDEAIDLASQYAGEGDIERASIYAAIAIVASPASLVRFHQDPAFESVINNPQLVRIIQARFELPLGQPAEPENQLSPLAEQNLGRLQSLARLGSPGKDKNDDAVRVSESIPASEGRQPVAQTFEQLQQVLDLSPAVLLEELRKPQKQWILHSGELMSMLEMAIDSKMSNE